MTTVFSPKDPGETFILEFDFAAELGGAPIATKNVTVEVEIGTDPSPNDVLSEPATIKGTRVMQKVSAGVEGVIYKFTALAGVADGRALILTGTLAVISK